jgi:hypothetical protein
MCIGRAQRLTRGDVRGIWKQPRGDHDSCTLLEISGIIPPDASSLQNLGKSRTGDHIL